MFDAAEAAFGGIVVLVNNAGVLQQAPLVEVDDDQFDRIIAINLKGSFNAMREAGRRLREGGRIINFSSSLVGNPAAHLRRLRRQQGGGGGDDADPGEGAARAA